MFKVCFCLHKMVKIWSREWVFSGKWTYHLHVWPIWERRPYHSSHHALVVRAFWQWRNADQIAVWSHCLHVSQPPPMIMSDSRWAPESGSGLTGPGWVFFILFSFRLTFPQHDQASGAPFRVSSNLPSNGARSTALAAGKWGHRWCHSLLALQYLPPTYKQSQHESSLIPPLNKSLTNKQVSWE